MKCIVKNGKFLSGHFHDYFKGYAFRWSRNESDAKRFEDQDDNIQSFVKRTKGSVREISYIPEPPVKYLLVFKDYAYKVEEITQDDMQACRDGYVSIISLKDMMQYSKLGEWIPLLTRINT